MSERVTPEQAEYARRMLEFGASQRNVARHVGISVAVVNRIAQGKWRPTLKDDGHPYWRERQRAKRCDGCGGYVYLWPCKTCSMRRRGEMLKKAA